MIIKKYVFSPEQFREFMEDKICYHHQCFWIEIWNGLLPIEKYIPCKEFILSNTIKLKRYSYKGYSEKCLDIISIEGKSYWEYIHWRATIGRNGKIYVRELQDK